MEAVFFHYIGEALYMLAGLAVGYLWRSLRVGRRDYGLIREGVCALLRGQVAAQAGEMPGGRVLYRRSQR